MTVLRQADAAVIRRITTAFRQGDETIDLGPYEADLPTGRTVSVDPLVELLAATMERFADDRSGSDSWLGPRLHAALRLTRAEAAIPGVWTWLGLGSGAAYVRWRWSPQLDQSRFAGAPYLHALGRLWWMAELFRNGSDYGPAEAALRNGDIAQNFLRMDIAHHRPTCQAFMLVSSRRRPGEAMTGREANALAKAANCAATTLVYEAIAPDVPFDSDARRDWVEVEVDVADLIDDMPAGPGDPQVPAEAVATMTAVLTEIFADAPIRGDRGDEGDSGTSAHDTEAPDT